MVFYFFYKWNLVPTIEVSVLPDAFFDYGPTLLFSYSTPQQHTQGQPILGAPWIALFAQKKLNAPCQIDIETKIINDCRYLIKVFFQIGKAEVVHNVLGSN